MGNDLLSQLPLFATDQELAIAIVGKERAAMWRKVVIPQLEKKGFPRIDPLHDGRPVPLVKKFYDGYFGITAGFSVAAPDGKENLGLWKSWRRDKYRPQLSLDARLQKILRFMVDHPECTAPDAIPDAGPVTMERLVAKGAIRSLGDGEYAPTDEGIAELERLKNWYSRAQAP
ncbi:hypothetical protein [Sinorhizobium fredii]|uniref:hypothetical protein n=1 Tax=Rhizobium fredii TaxID=380 RepID=UPI003398DE0E